jgi:RNA polymerase sigma-70 factor (ECF subfamily)
LDLELERTRKLIEAARGGRREAYEELFRMYRGALERELHGRLRVRADARFDASDVVQEALADAVRGFDSFEHRGPGSFRRWLARILENRVRMMFQHARREKRDRAREVAQGLGNGTEIDRARSRLAASITSPSAAAAAGEERARVARALEQLSPDHRTVIRLVRLEQRTIAEAAASMGRSENAVKKLLARALLALRDALRPPNRAAREPESR